MNDSDLCRLTVIVGIILIITTLLLNSETVIWILFENAIVADDFCLK